jgi:hypothetical protein
MTSFPFCLSDVFLDAPVRPARRIPSLQLAYAQLPGSANTVS